MTPAEIEADRKDGMPERIWIDWKRANSMDYAYDEPPINPWDDVKDEYVRADLHTSACLDALAAMGQAGEHLDTIKALTARAEQAEASLVAQVQETERTVARAERLREALDEIDNAAEPHHWCPELRHARDVAKFAIADDTTTQEADK